MAKKVLDIPYIRKIDGLTYFFYGAKIKRKDALELKERLKKNHVYVKMFKYPKGYLLYAKRFA